MSRLDSELKLVTYTY